MTLDQLFPLSTYRIRASRHIAAPPAIVWEELLTLPLSSLPVTFALTALRHLPAVMTRRERPLHGRQTFLDETPIPVLVHNKPYQVISGGLSQPWRLFGGPVAPVLDLDQLRQWRESGWVKVAMSFELRHEHDTDSTTLSTQTLIAVVDEVTARQFAPYWRLIKGSSALIRREVVAQVKRRAEARDYRLADGKRP